MWPTTEGQPGAARSARAMARWPRERLPEASIHHAASRTSSSVKPRRSTSSALRCCQATACSGPFQWAVIQRALELQNEQSPS